MVLPPNPDMPDPFTPKLTAADELKVEKFPLLPDFRLRALNWTRNFPYASFLNGHNYALPYGPFPEVLAVGEEALDVQQIFSQPAGCFGYFGYDCNFPLPEESLPPREDEFPQAVFFRALHEIRFFEKEVAILSACPAEVFKELQTMPVFVPAILNRVPFRAETQPGKYLQDVDKIKDLIREGWVYELNYCQFFEKAEPVCGLSAYLKLDEAMPMPFSGWLKFPGFEIACASPERFLRKEGQKLISQPIKGTAKRGKTPEEDARIRTDLLVSEKERAENLMIVDLVRNDLNAVSQTGSVQVEELFGIYAYPSVFQMISTVASAMEHPNDALKAMEATFPMGSMTGAPKKEVMKRIAGLETRKRGPFSGCLGYTNGAGNFDFNVLIRSVFINHLTGKAFFGVGSAITIDAFPLPEWEECRIKASRILEIFGEDWQDLFR